MLRSKKISRKIQMKGGMPLRGLALLVAISAIFFVNNLVIAQGNWEDNASNPQTWTTGSVGAGITSPLTPLHVRGLQIPDFTGTTRGMLSLSGDYEVGYYTAIDFLYRDVANPTARIAAYHDGSGSKLIFGTSDHYASGITSFGMAIDKNGKVGIGTTNPTNKLEVNGNVTVNTPTNAGSVGLLLNEAGSNSAYIHHEGEYHNGYLEIEDYSSGWATVGLVIKQGNVGVGTINPQSRLAVDGKVTCKEVEVTLDGWADFVFADNYQLMPLEKVEQHIQKNKHLPDIPSEKEVLENGVNVGDIQVKLLQKVEELTLYMIELKKENKLLKERVSLLE